VLLNAAATIKPPPTRRAASTARLTRLLLSSDLLRVAAWVAVGLCLGSGFALVVGGLLFCEANTAPFCSIAQTVAHLLILRLTFYIPTHSSLFFFAKVVY
jgi:hypothetical protein